MKNETKFDWMKNRPSRRGFLGGATAAGAGLAALGLVGCGDDDDDPGGETPEATNTTAAGETPQATATAQPTATPEGGPQRGGTLIGAQTSDLNMSTGYPFVSLAENPFINQLPMETVIRYRGSLEPELVLAERYEFNDDRSKLVVTLQPDLEFHNGAPVTAEDLTFGIKLIKDPEAYGVTGTFQLIQFANAVTDMKVINEREVEFTFDKPRGNINDLFAQLMVAHEASYPKTQSGEEINGTGAFKFTSWVPGQSVDFEANPNWHATGSDGPYLDGVSVKIFGDQDAMGLSYRAGELDLVLGPQASLAKEFQDLTVNALKTGLTYMGMNVTNPQLLDPRVRKAIFLAVDRERITNELREGFTPVTSQPWPEASPAFDPALEAALFDPDESRRLLAEAAWDQTEPIPFDHRTTAIYVDLASVIQQNLSDIGIEVELIPSDPTAFLAILRAREFKGLWTTTHSFAHMSPLTNFQVTFPFRQPNLSYYETETYLDIVAKLEELDSVSEEAKEQYRRFNEIWVEDPFMVPLNSNALPQLFSERVQGYGEFLNAPNAALFDRVSLS